MILETRNHWYGHTGSRAFRQQRRSEAEPKVCELRALARDNTCAFTRATLLRFKQQQGVNR
jgi:hypothetical protein